MSTLTAPHQRHALGMPAGSVRALLAFGVLAYLWILVLTVGDEGRTLLTQKDASETFLFLQLLMVLILAHFFSAQRPDDRRDGQPPLAAGPAARLGALLLLGGYLGMLYYTYRDQTHLVVPDKPDLIFFLGAILVAFIVGHALTGLVRRFYGEVIPASVQDVQAWFALIGLMMLGVVVLMRLVINTSLPLEGQLGLAQIEAVMAGMISFYFGARS